MYNIKNKKIFKQKFYIINTTEESCPILGQNL